MKRLSPAMPLPRVLPRVLPRLLPHLLVVAALLVTAPASADQDALQYLYEPKLPAELQPLMNRMLAHARNGEFEAAIDVSKSIVDATENLRPTNPATYGKVLTNHGILFTAAGDYGAGLAMLQSGAEQLGRHANPFSRALINNIMATGLAQLALADFTSAEDTFRRAQHITHRQGGVYNLEQISIINHITTAQLKGGHATAADREQRFALRISEKEYGPDTPELLPALNRLGSYFATRGSAMPVTQPAELRLRRDLLFKDSIRMYKRAIAIIENHHGKMDLRLLGPLRGLASARLLQATSRKHAEQLLQRALAIVEASPDTDIGDRARSLIDIADLYTITSDKRAAGHYLRAWGMLQDREETRLAATRYFGQPTRLYPPGKPVLYLDRKPDAARKGKSLFAELQYAVGKNGKVQSVEVLGKNVPNEQVRILRSRLRVTRFRPRIVDGEIVATEGMVLNQKYKLLD